MTVVVIGGAAGWAITTAVYRWRWRAEQWKTSTPMIRGVTISRMTPVTEAPIMSPMLTGESERKSRQHKY